MLDTHITKTKIVKIEEIIQRFSEIGQLYNTTIVHDNELIYIYFADMSLHYIFTYPIKLCIYFFFLFHKIVVIFDGCHKLLEKG